MLAFVIIAFVHAEQRNIYKKCTTKGKPRAFRFAVSTDVRCKSPEQGILILVVLILLFYTIDTAPTMVKKLSSF